MNSPQTNWMWNNVQFRKTSLFTEFSKLPLGFVDVGARGGVHPLVEPMAAGVAVMAFEPDPEAYKELKSMPSAPWANVEVEKVALGERKGKSELCLITSPTNNSLREPNPLFTTRYPMPKWGLEGKIEVDLDTMDNVLFGVARRAESHWGEFLKLDTQGTEYEILQGCRKVLLERSVMVVAELEFFKIYRDQKLFSDVEMFMRELGFSFYGFNNMFVRSRRSFPKLKDQKERWFYGDAVFVKDPFDRESGALSQRQAQALCMCALLNSYYDLAIEVAEKCLPNDLNAISSLVASIEKENFSIRSSNEGQECSPI